MSWDIFKTIMKSYMDNPNGVKSKEDFAKQFTTAYDSAMKLGSVTTRGILGLPLPLAKGNTEVMEKLMISACAIALTKSETGKHKWLKDIGQAVLGYWGGAQLAQTPPLIPPLLAFQNIALTSGIVSNPGKWPETPAEQPTDSAGNFLDLFILYAQIHLTTIQFSCTTISLYFGFPLIPPLPGFVQLTGYTLTPAKPTLVVSPIEELSVVQKLLDSIPDDNNTIEGATPIVKLVGTVEILSDDGEDAGPQINTIKKVLLESIPTPSVPTLNNPTEINVTSKLGDGVAVECGIGLDYDAQISPNFKVKDLSIKTTFPHKIKAQVGLSVNEIICNLKAVSENILEPILKKYPNMVINSAFRGGPSLPGGRISQHEKGEAVDLQFSGFSPKDYLAVTEFIVQNIAFDQIIFEHGISIWLHISHKRGGNRKKQLTMLKGKYEPGIKLYYV